MIDGNHLAFAREGMLPAGSTKIIAQTAPYDHCNMTVVEGAPVELVVRFRQLLLGMDYGDAGGPPLARPGGADQMAGPDGSAGTRPSRTRSITADFYDAEGGDHR